jgi:ATP-dependent Clp protease protease subunit
MMKDEHSTTSLCGGGNKETHVKAQGNKVFFFRGVFDDSVGELCTDLEETIKRIKTDFASFSELPLPPVQLYLNSFGGDLFAGFAAYHYIRQLQHPVHCHVVGCAMSAASLILLACDQRFISKYSFVLIHQLRTGFWGRHDELVDEAKNMNLVMTQLQRLYQERTKLSKARLETLLKHDLLLSAEDCKKAGLVQEIES